jgi:hypothetical protein
MLVIVELLYGYRGEEGKEKRTIINNIKTYYICASRGHNSRY